MAADCDRTTTVLYLESAIRALRSVERQRGYLTKQEMGRLDAAQFHLALAQSKSRPW